MGRICVTGYGKRGRLKNQILGFQTAFFIWFFKDDRLSDGFSWAKPTLREGCRYMKKGRLKTGNPFSDDLCYNLFKQNLFRQFGLLVRHEFLSDIGQEVEVTLVLLEDVGDEFAAVHVLHVVAAATVEEVGIGLVG